MQVTTAVTSTSVGRWIKALVGVGRRSTAFPASVLRSAPRRRPRNRADCICDRRRAPLRQTDQRSDREPWSASQPGLSFFSVGPPNSTNLGKGSSLRAVPLAPIPPHLQRATAVGALVSQAPSLPPGLFLFYFCCLDAQNGLTFTGQPARVFCRFPLAPWPAEFGRLRYPPAVAPIRDRAAAFQTSTLDRRCSGLSSTATKNPSGQSTRETLTDLR